MTATSRLPGSGFLLGLIVVLTSVVVFAGPIEGEFISDDISLIANNTNLRSPDAWKTALLQDFWSTSTSGTLERAIPRQMYRPIVSLAYFTEFQLFGRRPLGYHLVNLLLHGLCIALVFRWLLRRLHRSVAEPLLPAAAGALVFGLHPSRVESVAWISGCTDLWMSLFVLIGLELWDHARSLAGVAGALLAFIAAFLCKEVALMVPLALLADRVLLTEEPARPRSHLGTVIGGMGLAALLRLLKFPVPGGSSLAFGVGGLFVRLLATIGGFVRLALVPWPASMQSGYLASAVGGAAPRYPMLSVVVGALTVVVVVALLVLARRIRALRPWLADFAWFAIFLLPVLNFIPVSLVYYVAERYLYLPGIGLAALAARGTAHALQWAPRRRAVALVAGLVLAAGYAGGSVIHAGHFVTNEALWTYEHDRNPQNGLALMSLIDTRSAQHRWTEAQALSIDLMRLMPHAIDKADAFARWLDLEMARTVEGDLPRLRQVQADYELIAAGQPLPPPDATLYDQVGASGRAWLPTSRSFRVRRAAAALNVLNHPLARPLLEELANDPATRVSAWRLLVLECLASMDVDAADRHLAEARRLHVPVDGYDQLKEASQAVRAMLKQKNAPDITRLYLARVFAQLGERALAVRLAEDGLVSTPQSIPLQLLLVDLAIDGNRFDDAQKIVAELRKAHPEENARWEQSLAAIRSAQQTWQLTQAGL